MNLDQLRAFANSDEQHIRQIGLTREAARALIREHDQEVRASVDPLLFDIPERDDGKYARRLFSVYAKAEADFQKARGSV